MEISDIHDQASLDQYWAEHGGPPRLGDKPDELVAAERAVIEAAIRWGTVTGLEFRQAEEYLRSHVLGLLGRRAAQESGT